VKPRLVALISLMILLGASGFLYFKATRDRDQDRDYAQHEDDVTPQPGEIEEAEEETEPEPGEDEEVIEETEPQPEEDEEAEEKTEPPPE
jgi:cytoskeletal protein RodZ